jgi:hypothetical protein
MNPIYFPFTYIPESVGKILAACFRQTAVYQISAKKIPEDMQKLSQEGILDIRIPLEVSGEFLDKVLKDYRAWVNVHQGTETAFLAAMANKIPFFYENASSQIRADLKKIGKQAPLEEKPDPLFNANLFLHMAQEFDLQMEALDQDMMDIEAMEDDFMKSLKWEDGDDHDRGVSPKALGKDDPGHYMTNERINAWTSLMLLDSEVSGLYVSTSQAILEHLIESNPEMEQIACLEAIPMGVDENETLSNWQDSLIEALKILAIENWPVATDDMASPPEISRKATDVKLTIYIVPNKTPHECFAGSVEADVLKAGSAQTSTHFKNTLIGLVEKNG